MQRTLFLCSLGALFGVHVALSPFIYILFGSGCMLFFTFKKALRTPTLLFPFVLIMLLFFIRAETVEYYSETKYSGEENQLLGKVADIPVFNGDRLTVLFETLANERVMVSYSIPTEKKKNELRNLTPGHTCLLDGNLSLPSEGRNFNGFNYRQYLSYQHIYWLYEPDDMTLNQCTDTNVSWFDRLKQWRQYGVFRIEERFPPEIAGIVAALVFGDRSLITSEVIDAYQGLGIIHLLAVSGLHVGAVSGALYYVLIRVGVVREHALLLLLLLLPCYALLTGAAPSVIRSVSMAVVIILFFLIRTEGKAIDSLSIVFMTYVFLQPSIIFHIGFQLSFFISLALILSSTTLLKSNMSRVKQLVMVTLLCQIASFPIILFNFYEFSLLSFFVNVIYIPVVTLFIFPSSMIIFFLSFIDHYFVQILISTFDHFITFLHQTLIHIHQSGYVNLIFGVLPKWVYIAMVLSILWVFACYEKQKQLFISLSLFICIVVFAYLWPYVHKEGAITILDVGQGDSILIELPYRQAVYLIDAGGAEHYEKEHWQKQMEAYDPGEQVVVPYLKSRGIRSIDKAIVTHGHSDHMGGMDAVLNTFQVNQLIYGYGEPVTDQEEQFLKKVIEKEVDLTFAQSIKGWKKGPYHFRVLSPKKNEEKLNDRSVVLLANFLTSTWLYTGDLEESGEKFLMQTHPELKADVLKVGHHGSDTSTKEKFLQQLNVKVALISAGVCNHFGHPHANVIHRLNEHEVRTLRTDLVGAIRFSFTRKGDWRVESKLGDPLDKDRTCL